MRVSRPLLTTLAALPGVAAVLGTAWLSIRTYSQTTVDPDGLYLGVQTDENAAMRMAFRQVINDVSRSPRARNFRVNWNSDPIAGWLHIDEEYSREGITYDLGRQTIEAGGSGGSYIWQPVSVSMLAMAARANDPLHALEKAGCTVGP